MQEVLEWVQDALVRWNQDANRIMSENPWYLVVILILCAYALWTFRGGLWLRILLVHNWFAHCRRKTVGRQLRDCNAREYFADGHINLVNYMWLSGMITEKKKNWYFKTLAHAFSEPDFLLPKTLKPLPKEAQNHKKKQLIDGLPMAGPVSPLPGDKPEQDPAQATRKSMPKKGKVVVFG